MTSRRDFLAAGAGALLFPAWRRREHGIGAQPAAPAAAAGTRTGRDVELTMTAAPARLSLLPGLQTDVFAFNGRTPGPVIELVEGDHVTIHYRNELPEPSTIHWHGLHLPNISDGSPFYPVAPGASYDYEFDVMPGSAGTYWYHPHPDGRAGYQVARGLYGALIIRAPDDPLASLPDRLIVLADNRFLDDGSVDWPDPESPAGRVDTENGREGDVVFVNGKVMPTLPIRAGEVQRWRIVNASGARVYRLALAGHTFLQVGSDGGLFEKPVECDEVLLANAERVELLVRGTGEPGSRATLQALPYDRYIPQMRPADWTKTRDLLTLEYSDEPAVTPAAIPAVLRPVPAIDPASATVNRVISMSQGLLNGKRMDLKRVDQTAKLGTTEIWQIENLVGMDHPFHLHGFQFQVLDRNGVPEPFPCWKDTVNVPKHTTARFIVRFDDYPGKWMFHCHILSHEDMGMMGVLQTL